MNHLSKKFLFVFLSAAMMAFGAVALAANGDFILEKDDSRLGFYWERPYWMQEFNKGDNMPIKMSYQLPYCNNTLNTKRVSYYLTDGSGNNKISLREGTAFPDDSARYYDSFSVKIPFDLPYSGVIRVYTDIYLVNPADKRGPIALVAYKNIVIKSTDGDPSVDLTANPENIDAGQSSLLSWTSENAAKCSGSGFDAGGSVSGSVSVSPNTTTTYSVICSSASGKTAADSVTVNVNNPQCVPNVGALCDSPSSECGMTRTGNVLCDGTCSMNTPPSLELCPPATVDISAGSIFVPKGETTLITWDSQNAINCQVIGPGGVFATGESGSKTSEPVEQAGTYTLRCEDKYHPGEFREASVLIKIHPGYGEI